MTEPTATRERATIGGGCFWCVEAVYEHVRGVEKVVSGYCGGDVPNPTYRAVCGGDTGHAEVVQIDFDPRELPYRDLLEIFFAVHDPTTLNRQGADAGTQYRSVIFWHDENQRQTAQALIAELDAAKIFPRPIVTELTRFEKFWEAEEYHQSYFRKNPGDGYCQYVALPKVAKLRQKFAERWKD